jgi:NAD(P)-dependent dehydrogenase (short-subunit alcohol dehydrogenase family)
MIGRAWCTGASKGIGQALSFELAARGVTVFASARSGDELDVLAGDPRAARRIYSYPLDVTDEAAVAATVEAMEAAHGPLDLAVLNAGTHIPVDAKDFSSRVFRQLFEVNVFGVVHGLAALLPRFIARGHGQIAVVSSVAGYCGLPSAAAYGASKAALINMCEALKPELDRAGVDLRLINPGFVRTPLTDQNAFPMPFLMEPDAAARRIVDGLGRRGFEITFPRRFTYGLKLLRALPYPLFFAVTRRLLRP